MKYSFKRTTRGRVFSVAEFYSYQCYLASIVSFIYSLLSEGSQIHSVSLTITGILFGMASIATVIDLCQTMRDSQKCFIYDVLRLIVSVALCIIAFTCFDTLF